tara:strand:- start:292 stop:1641 length:1350 start_codon:yes stop_codon:yes gene_type:complete
MRQVTPAWKLVTAVTSLLLTVFLWQQGLRESFDRPSVAPELSLKQQEMALVASPVVPKALQPVLVGLDPEGALRQTLIAFPQDKIKDRERLIFAALEESEDKRKALLKFSLNDQSFSLLKNVLSNTSDFSSSKFSQLENLKKDPLLYQVSCFALGGTADTCINQRASQSMALRLVGIQAFPLLATLLGLCLLIRQGWLIFRKKNMPWPSLPYLPLSVIDMTLLIAGGFVVLGEVVLPTFVIPLISFLIKDISAPVNESLKVFVGYIAMTIPPLFILRQQLKGLKEVHRPPNGWLQFNFKPIEISFFKAISGWLMIMPFVLLTGFLMNFFLGDQGGSNPLLDLVLNSDNKLALSLLLITTVVLAPAFEEVVFRGALLPVLGQELGGVWAIIVSALAFALAHLSVGELPPLFVLGLGLGVLRLSSGRLFPCVIMHSLWNGITFSNLLLLGG